MGENQEVIGGAEPVLITASGAADALPSAPAVRLEKRPLTAAEAACLHEELKSTPNILGYTVSELLRFSRVLVAVADAEEGEVFAGASLCKDLLWGWTEISVVYVLPAFRGHGISTRLFTTALSDALDRKRSVFTLSRSPEVIHLMRRLGMSTNGCVLKAPLAVHLEMNRHMMSLYRWREAGRKMKMRKNDGYQFLGGIKRV